MIKNTSFQIENTTFQGKLTYGNGNQNEIKCTLVKPHSNILQDLFKSENGCFFTFSGTIENIGDFTAVNCDVRDGIKPIHYLLVENDRKLDYKINIGTLYIGVSNINKNIKNIKKCEFNISHQIPFLKNTQQVNIHKYNFNIRFDKSISLIELNLILFDLKIFFQMLVLNEDIEITEKYFYLKDGTKIQEIKKYEKEKEKNQSKVSYLIKENDKLDIEKSLNLWFEAKERYGKIFDYLSGILKESTLKHMEFKLFALSQWIEAYSREFLKDSALQIINSSLIKEIDKKFLNSISGKNNTFRTNLNGLFIIKNLEQLVFDNLNRNKKDYLISDLVCYRNNLTHLNVKDNLNNQQAINLYEILKNLIYLFIMEELQVQDDRNYDYFKNEANYFYKKYDALSKILEKCKDK